MAQYAEGFVIGIPPDGGDGTSLTGPVIKTEVNAGWEQSFDLYAWDGAAKLYRYVVSLGDRSSSDSHNMASSPHWRHFLMRPLHKKDGQSIWRVSPAQIGYQGEQNYWPQGHPSWRPSQFEVWGDDNGDPNGWTIRAIVSYRGGPIRTKLIKSLPEQFDASPSTIQTLHPD